MRVCFDIQDFFLDSLQYHQLSATFYLMNGYQLKGQLIFYNDEVLIVKSADKQQIRCLFAVVCTIDLFKEAFKTALIAAQNHSDDYLSVLNVNCAVAVYVSFQTVLHGNCREESILQIA